MGKRKVKRDRTFKVKVIFTWRDVRVLHPDWSVKACKAFMNEHMVDLEDIVRGHIELEVSQTEWTPEDAS